jgi:hypothetical protein
LFCASSAAAGWNDFFVLIRAYTQTLALCGYGGGGVSSDVDPTYYYTTHQQKKSFPRHVANTQQVLGY